jgi:Family of unknown function (DUF5677)
MMSEMDNHTETGASEPTPGGLFDNMLRLILEGAEPDAPPERYTALIEAATSSSAPVIAEELGRMTPRMLIDHRALRIAFETRLADPWGPALDAFEALYVATVESGEAYIRRVAEEANAEEDQVFPVLVRLHARACHVASEIYALLRSGHASGAHARWRTMHEIAVVMSFVAGQGDEVARRYLEHRAISSWHEVEDFQAFATRLGQVPYTPEELEEMAGERTDLLVRYGKDFDRPWGWAAAALYPAPPTFRSLETAVDLAHWRPYYAMASHGLHGGPRALYFRLGVLDALETLIVGPSNLGLGDPGTDAALSIGVISATLLTHRPDLEGLTTAKVIHALVERAMEAFSVAEAELEQRVLEEETAGEGDE